ncbi:MAG: A/G-specific adenine glycosylase [Paludibacteraceae bacterium]|nr:A/G-specific adenine glycosylase [Paludibacteraceae bacterium]
MLSNNILQSFSPIITKWYENNKRELPWRETTDPYKIWLSEIILQQTRVNQGLNYYLRFIERFPDVKALANADEIEILKLWQGLGYYSRARNIHAAARMIVEKHNGIFPTDHKDILLLKGIGDYTAAAITSFAYNEAYAVVDGNVFRVLARIFGIDTPIDSVKGKKEFTLLATDLLDKKQPSLHNQAIMEFGALQCVPMSPACGQCVLNNFCVAYLTDSITDFPKKEQKLKQRERFFNYLFIRENNYTYLNKRTGKDVWHNLYEFPLIETGKAVRWEELVQMEQFKALFGNQQAVEITGNVYQVKHVLSHQIIHTSFYQISVGAASANLKGYERIEIGGLEDYPVSRLTELFLQKNNI